MAGKLVLIVIVASFVYLANSNRITSPSNWQAKYDELYQSKGPRSWDQTRILLNNLVAAGQQEPNDHRWSYMKVLLGFSELDDRKCTYASLMEHEKQFHVEREHWALVEYLKHYFKEQFHYCEKRVWKENEEDARLAQMIPVWKEKLTDYAADYQ